MKYIILILILFLGGCAVGRGPMGEIILGIEAGTLADSTGAVIGQAANAIFPGLGKILGFGGGAVLTTVLGAWAKVRATDKKRKRADQAREVATREKAELVAAADALERRDLLHAPVPTPVEAAG